ncbi:metallophosphoesterase [Sediminibacter sp. Hel_I_10]|uniref:metallophosphoesterase n=1 Tax=Sediminibacter sp. Hel_I_10 TaxID=1392490 RepID=UPI00047DAA85|nr:metallophosphoesterase [Sediminibacter sp. Hel_I_10]
MEKSGNNIHALYLLLFLSSIFSWNGIAQDSFEFVVLPDTQTYMEEFPEVYMSQMKWLAENNERFSFVLHVGDVTQNNSEAEWQIAKNGFSLLNGKLPYNIALGNHDMGSAPGKFADIRNTSLANMYFPSESYKKNSNTIAVFPENSIDNSCAEYHLIGQKWLVFSLEFGPQNKTIEWVNEIIRQHPNHKIILNTHAYLYTDNTLHDGDDWYLPQKYGIGKDTDDGKVNDGGLLWEKLIKIHKNTMFVFSGHILGSGVGTLVSKNDFGNKVYQMLANFQKNVKGVEQGNSGYLRIIEVNKATNTIAVKTYSPWLHQFQNAPEHHFTFQNIDF